ncbi:uncharacterized protein FIBRA_05954 [Fibroporia radiculosa]|uniref:SH3 domain-containing protein n=1 Tax=Fibroporia radiculosa TaxID=599839 RepID=J4IB02_9APHY|nr:uncharacterized protein FIBRA_05954 [Fibroporia radiculosa]CCM03806.1 predicted protein [Fibroporia radiculosa]
MRRSKRSPAARARHQQVSTSPPAVARRDSKDDTTVTDSVVTQTETKVKNGSTSLSTEVFTTKVTITTTPTSSSSSTTTSTSTSSKKSSTSSSSSSHSSSSSSSSSSTSTNTSNTSTSSSSSSPTTSSTSGQSTSPATSPTTSTLTSAHSLATTSSSTGNGASPTNGSSLSSGQSGSKGLSTGAIIGIAVGGGALVFLILIYIIRKRCLHRKERRMNEWLGRDPVEPSVSSVEKPPLSPVDRSTSFSTNTHNSRRELIPEQARRQYIPPSQALAQQSMPSAAAVRSMAGYNNNGGFSPMYDNQPQAVQYHDPSMGYANVPASVPIQYRGPAPLATQYNNAYTAPAPAVPPPTHIQTPTGSPRVHPPALTPSNARARQASVSFALVRNGFVPSLVDELAVGAGEMVRVLEEYDDGWALCANMRGSQGVVPQDVLQRNRASTAIGSSADSGMGMAPPMRSRDDQLAFVSPQSTTMERPY